MKMQERTLDGHLVQIRTQLPKAGTLKVVELNGTEAISEPFSFQFKLLADEPFPFNDLLGQPATFLIRPLKALLGSTSRYLNGIVSELRQSPPVYSTNDLSVKKYLYAGVLAPRLWLLTQKVQTR